MEIKPRYLPQSQFTSVSNSLMHKSGCTFHVLPAIAVAIVVAVSMQSSACVDKVLIAALFYAGPQGSVLQVPTSSPAFLPPILKAVTLPSTQ